jgi:[CysO sulfur-carrier protein]-S-L-cysteine hydrolase
MKLILPRDITAQLVQALEKAGAREIGGILMGEHVEPDTFRVKAVTIQLKGGTFATFIRRVADVLAPLRSFFNKTHHDYTRFNYLGEWHSHHSFALSPSGQDNLTMQSMVMDSSLGARFVILLLVKQDRSGQFKGAVTVYQPYCIPSAGNLMLES